MLQQFLTQGSERNSVQNYPGVQLSPQAIWNKSSDPRGNLGSQVQIMQKGHGILHSFTQFYREQLGLVIVRQPDGQIRSWDLISLKVIRTQKQGRGDMNHIYHGSNMKLTMNSSYSPVI